MKLDLTKLSKYEKLVAIASPKTGMRKKDSLYFNFDEKKIFIHSDYMVAYINFDFSINEGEEYQNVFFDTKKLFIILNNFNKNDVELVFELMQNDVLIPKFLKGKDSFTIEHLLGDEEDFEVNFLADSVDFKIDDFLSTIVKEAYQFVDQTKDNQFNSIAINNVGVYGVTPARLYEFKTNLFDSKLIEDENIIIHRDVAKFISSLTEEDSCDCFYSDGKIKFEIDNTFQFVFAIPYKHTIIPTSVDIETNFASVNSIRIDRKLLLDTLKFFDPFYSQDSKPIRLSLISDTELELSTVSDFDTIKKIIPINGSSILNGFVAEYNGDIIKLALNNLTVDNVDIFCDFEKLGIVITAEDDLQKIVAIMKYQE